MKLTKPRKQARKNQVNKPKNLMKLRKQAEKQLIKKLKVIQQVNRVGNADIVSLFLFQ